MKEPIEKHKYKHTLDLNEALPALQGLIKVSCPSCNNSVPAANIELKDKLAKCNACDGIFSFSKIPQVTQPKPKSDPKTEVLHQEGIEVFHFQNELDISFQQPFGKTEDIVSFILLGTFFPLTLIFLPLGLTEEPILLIPAILFFVLSFIIMIRLVLKKKNKTYITVDDNYLSIIQRPYRFPFVKDEYYFIDEIDQIYTKKCPNPSGSGKSFFEIHAILNTPNGQKHVKLSPILESKSKARYIEQEIERHLGITDRPVPEED